MYDGDKQPWHIDTSSMGPPWWPRWMEFLNMAIRARGGSTEVSSNLYEWVSQHGAFENVEYQEVWLPASPWMQGNDPETLRLRWIGECARDDVLVRIYMSSLTSLFDYLSTLQIMLKSGRPLLLGNGMPEEFMKELEENAGRELMEAKVPHYSRIIVVTALKKHLNPS
jgi:hypothetical protein